MAAKFWLETTLGAIFTIESVMVLQSTRRKKVNVVRKKIMGSKIRTIKTT